MKRRKLHACRKETRDLLVVDVWDARRGYLNTNDRTMRENKIQEISRSELFTPNYWVISTFYIFFSLHFSYH